MGIFEGFAGTTAGSFFKEPAWVDTSKPPGHTSQAEVYGDWWKIWKGYLNLSFFFYSPNLVWFSIAAAVYIIFPYDFEAGKEYKLDWIAHRFFINLFVVYAYFGFWNVTMYIMNFGKRKFNPNKNPSVGTMAHNIWYSTMGVVQWTVWEAGFVNAYATGRLGYVKDSEHFESWQSMLKLAAWCLFVPFWRDFHFYFAHRFLHIRFLYKYVHSLHHRNTDIEPFSGLCMHPVEHLYYYSCVGPSLFIHASPFIMLWNGIHLLISPAASHSGWEDNFQSDQFHYLHHAQFECNYGTSGPPLDKLFGTFREKLGKSKEYQGEASEVTLEKSPANEYLSGSVKFNPLPTTLQQAVFNTLAYGSWVLLYFAVMGQFKLDGYPYEMAYMTAFGPIVFGVAVLWAFKDTRPTLWPFHKETFGRTGFHMVVSAFMVLLPVYFYVTTILLQPGQSAYFSIMDKLDAARATYTDLIRVLCSQSICVVSIGVVAFRLHPTKPRNAFNS